MHCHHSPAVRWLYKIALLLVALVAINFGLAYFHYDYVGSFTQNYPKFVAPLQILVGLAGVLLLVTVILHLFGMCRHDEQHHVPPTHRM